MPDPSSSSARASDQGASVAAGPDTTFTLDYGPPLPDGAACTITIVAAGVRDVDDPPDPPAGDIEIDFTVVAGRPMRRCRHRDPGHPGQRTGGRDHRPRHDRGRRRRRLRGPVADPARLLHPGSRRRRRRGHVRRHLRLQRQRRRRSTSATSSASPGTAAEFQDQTQISATSMAACGTGASVTPVDVTFPVASATFLERYEGMLVRLPQTLSVTEHFQLGRFGQVVLSSDGRRPAARPPSSRPARRPTRCRPPTTSTGSSSTTRSRARTPTRSSSAAAGTRCQRINTLRGGDTATGIVGRHDLHLGRQRGQRQRLPRPADQRPGRQRSRTSSRPTPGPRPRPRSVARSGSPA